jgi:hypothetical protein
LLISILDRYKPHIGSSNGFADGFGVRCVRFIGLYIRLHELRRHELHRMSLGLQPSRPIVSTSTGFHANQAGWLLGEKGQYLLASQSSLNNDFAALINTVHLEHIFGQIDPIVVIFILVASL